MPQKKKSLSNVIPVLLAAIVCDVAVADPSTQKKNLIGVFDKIYVGKFPTKRPISLYIKLTDADGYYQTEIRYVRVNTGDVIANADGELQVNHKLVSPEILIQFPPLPIPEEGRYEFQIWANNVFLGSTFVDALKHPEPKEA